MPRIEVPTELSAEQKRVAEPIVKAIGALGGPYGAWIHRPELASRIHNLSDYFRAGTVIPNRIRMLAVLLTIRHWNARFPWSAQTPHAVAAGLSLDTITAIGAGAVPNFADGEEEIAYRFVTELLDRRAISDATWSAAQERFGKDVLIELVAVVGHFTTVCLTAVACAIEPVKAPAAPLVQKPM